jgi:hypothetical protein
MKNKLFVFGLALFLSVSFVNFAHATDVAGTAVNGSVGSGTVTMPPMPPAPPAVDTTNFTEAQKTALASAKTLMDQAKSLQEQATKILKDAGITPKMMGRGDMKGDKDVEQEDNKGGEHGSEKVFDMKMPANKMNQNSINSVKPDVAKKSGDMKKPKMKKDSKKMGDKKEGDKKGGEGKGPFTGDRKGTDSTLPPVNNNAPAQNAPAANQ